LQKRSTAALDSQYGYCKAAQRSITGLALIDHGFFVNRSTTHSYTPSTRPSAVLLASTACIPPPPPQEKNTLSVDPHVAAVVPDTLEALYSYSSPFPQLAPVLGGSVAE